MRLNGEIELHRLDEKVRFLKLKIAEKQRQIFVGQKLVPIKKSLENELRVLQIQVGDSGAPVTLSANEYLFSSFHN